MTSTGDSNVTYTLNSQITHINVPYTRLTHMSSPDNTYIYTHDSFKLLMNVTQTGDRHDSGPGRQAGGLARVAGGFG